MIKIFDELKMSGGMGTGIAIMFLVAFILALVAIGPLTIIWALNTLFPMLAIPYTLETWLSVVLLHGFCHTVVSFKK
jgi:hypothetical protein